MRAEMEEMCIRRRTEEMEDQFLSDYAARSSQSRGRKIPEEADDLRTCYARDRDRILHSKAFRRLMHKTQVFIAPEGDHYRTRLTHTLEVSQIARSISRALRLNEDLTEAIALGHDLGHTPFGHAGERVLNSRMQGGFSHAQQGVRVASVLEKHGGGLNLTWEVLDGIANHSFSRMPSTMEGQVVRYADKLAYIHHDIDDAIRGRILCEEDLPGECTDILGHNVKDRLNRMVRDIIGPSIGSDRIIMRPESEKAMLELRKYLFQHVYIGSSAKAEEGKAEVMVEDLVDYYRKNPEEIPAYYRIAAQDDIDMMICDYVSSMSDHYALHLYEELFIPKAWKVL